jgi:hypothetical protein
VFCSPSMTMDCTQSGSGPLFATHHTDVHCRDG